MGKKVLIVDDSATARMLIRRCFEIAGWMDAEFVEASDGQDALGKISGDGVDLLVTDLNMPNMDGVELVRRVRGGTQCPECPVIVITSTGNEAKEAQLREVGASLILSKPISPAMISDALEKLFGGNQ